MVYQVLEWTCTVIAFAAFAYRLGTLPGNHRDPTHAALCVYFFGSFFSFVIGLDAVSPHVADLFHYRNVTIILSHAAVVVLTAAQLVVLTYWALPPERARHRARLLVAGFAVALAVLVTMFLVSFPMERQGTSATSSLLNLRNSGYALYVALYTVLIAAGQVVTVRVSWRFAGTATQPWLRRSMRTVAVGGVFILGYCGMRLFQVAATQLKYDVTAYNPVQWFLGDVGSLLELLGWTAPGWGPALAALPRWVRAYRRYHQLRPLWEALHRATPDIVLGGPRSRVADAVPGDLGFRLYRRVIEILDGQRALRPYLAPPVDANGPTAEAQWVREALKAKASGRPPVSAPAPAPGEYPEDLAGETDRLVAVARAFQREP
ncbi:hypothetical protein Val02_19540 [Virgisporangium aliadipatigenens]|uniref:DUF6545 domain-containing protein n=1 Tax=Virgisporangium aliadipatigenens TaxID=741659 RepID=A0A8J3YJM4_9ACTN|nr:MAB_1171c family putative transporter [Virgisporangium aliadipatigenens]GIJ45068.1 hypothetical protein Val02_19540 [Virgisporangium aliadipatigenens]